MALSTDMIDAMLMDTSGASDNRSPYSPLFVDESYLPSTRDDTYHPVKSQAWNDDNSNVKIEPISHPFQSDLLDVNEVNLKIKNLDEENKKLRQENQKLKEENKRLEQNLESIQLVELNHRITLQEPKKSNFFSRLFSWLFKHNNPYRKELTDGIVHKRV